jgi:hypothetical protein
MRIKETITRLTKNDTLLKFLGGIANVKSEFNQYLAKAVDSRPFRLVQEHKRPIEYFLYAVWLAGCGHWFYQLMIIDVKPKENLGLVLTDPRDALAVLFFGTLGSVFVLLFASFIIKLIYNLFHDALESFFSIRWHSLVKPAAYLVILFFAFSFTGMVKTAGLTAYNQIAVLVNTSNRNSIISVKEIPDDLEKKLSGLIKMIEEGDRQ